MYWTIFCIAIISIVFSDMKSCVWVCVCVFGGGGGAIRASALNTQYVISVARALHVKAMKTIDDQQMKIRLTLQAEILTNKVYFMSNSRFIYLCLLTSSFTLYGLQLKKNRQIHKTRANQEKIFTDMIRAQPMCLFSIVSVRYVTLSANVLSNKFRY